MGPFRSSLMIFSFMALGFELFAGPKVSISEQENPQQEKQVCFLWAFGAKVKTEKGTELIHITRDTTLKTGDRLKMFLELQMKCFVYIIYHSAQGDVALLFPGSFQQFDDDYQALRGYYIPKGEAWFQLEKPVGRETFYLLASGHRLVSLESLINDYCSASSARKPGLAGNILAEIRKMKKKHRQFRTAAERPIRTIGRLRTGHEPDDLASIAIEISENTFFSRTFTIDHQ